MGEPPGDDRDLGAGREQQRGGRTDAGYDGKCRHAARGPERATEAGGGGVWAMSRWMAFRDRKAGGERM